MKPIETIYNGYKFRSRLEARWAVFFDALGVEYEYEPDGFELDNGMYYLPDFRVKCWGNRGQIWDEPYDLWIEVKGAMSNEDACKIKNFVKPDFSLGTCGMNRVKNPLLVLGNIPLGISSMELYFVEMERCDIPPFNYCLIDGDYWVAMPAAINGKFFLWGADESQINNKTEVLKAYDIARKARFEHGEKPNVKNINAFRY